MIIYRCSTESLNQSEGVLKPCVGVAQASLDVLAKSTPDSKEPLETDASSKSTVESFIINTWLVSCALCNRGFCASPGSVAAYNGALSKTPPLFDSLLVKLGVYGSLGSGNHVLTSENAWAINSTDLRNGRNLSNLQLAFSRDQLISYKKWRIAGLDRKSVNWMNKATEIVWDCTHGVISNDTMDAVRYITLTKYACVYSQRKVLYFTKGLLKYLTKTTFDTRFQAFELFLEMPKILKIESTSRAVLLLRKTLEMC